MNHIVPWISLGVVLLGHLLASIIWATRIDTLLNIMRTQVDSISKDLGSYRDRYSTKEDVSMALKISEKEVAIALAMAQKENVALWKKIDEIKLKLEML